MRTTVDLPDALYRQLKSEAALRGATMRRLILDAIERELRDPLPVETAAPFPVVHSSRPGSLDLDADTAATQLEEEDGKAVGDGPA